MQQYKKKKKHLTTNKSSLTIKTTGEENEVAKGQGAQTPD